MLNICFTEERLDPNKRREEFSEDGARSSIKWERPDRSRVSWFNPHGLKQLQKMFDDFRYRSRTRHILEHEETREELDGYF